MTSNSANRVNHQIHINRFPNMKHFSTQNDDILTNNIKNTKDIPNRRSLLSNMLKVTLSTAAMNTQNSNAMEQSPPIDLLFESKPNQKELIKGLLETRVTENLMSPPTYGLEIPDVYYPEYFSGVWKVTSICTDVKAPCGTILFGGNNTYQSALGTIGLENALQYKARFIPSSSSSSSSSSSESKNNIIADRDYNVREIATSSMGSLSVLDIPIATPNRFAVTLAPQNSNSLISVDLLSLARRQEYIDESHFDCSEVVRQIIQPLDRQQQRVQTGRGPVLKEIETISLYTSINPGEIKAKQRTATFLMPSTTDPMAMKMWEVAKGRPIDVRFYDVIYNRI